MYIDEGRLRMFDLKRIWVKRVCLIGLTAACGPFWTFAQAPTTESTPDAAREARLDWYRYDAALPLNATVAPLDQTPTSTRFRLSYDSVHDQRVPAIVALPNRATAPYPAVILVHGSGGSKDTSYIKALSQALTYRGFATL